MCTQALCRDRYGVCTYSYGNFTSQSILTFSEEYDSERDLLS
jgi:hypothetical protein